MCGLDDCYGFMDQDHSQPSRPLLIACSLFASVNEILSSLGQSLFFIQRYLCDTIYLSITTQGNIT